jgi:hypothetical protein
MGLLQRDVFQTELALKGLNQFCSLSKCLKIKGGIAFHKYKCFDSQTAFRRPQNPQLLSMNTTVHSPLQESHPLAFFLEVGKDSNVPPSLSFSCPLLSFCHPVLTL